MKNTTKAEADRIEAAEAQDRKLAELRARAKALEATK